MKRIYCIDSSVFITLNRFYLLGLLPADLWDSLDELFFSGRIISHYFVFSEICPRTSNPDFLAKWIKNKERYFYPETARQAQLVADILSIFPGLINYDKEIDEADPWLISLAIEKKESADLFVDYSTTTIVSNEKVSSKDKIPAVCNKFKISHMTIKEFFDDNSWKMMLMK